MTKQTKRLNELVEELRHNSYEYDDAEFTRLAKLLIWKWFREENKDRDDHRY